MTHTITASNPSGARGAFAPAIRLLSALPLLLVLSACGQQDTPAPAAGDATPAPAAAAPAATTLDAPIDPVDIATRMTLVSGPIHGVADDVLEFEVEVYNDGGVALTSDGSKPVQLGVTLAGPEGVDVAPGVRDFVRVRLPVIPAGESRRVAVSIPAKPTEGLTVRLELVQEMVAWFNKYQQPTVDIGPFSRCDGGTGLCDATGAPIATR